MYKLLFRSFQRIIDVGNKRERPCQGVTKRCRLSYLINSALVYEPKCGGRGGVAGSQPMSTAVHRSPNKLWRSISIFNLWFLLTWRPLGTVGPGLPSTFLFFVPPPTTTK